MNNFLIFRIEAQARGLHLTCDHVKVIVCEWEKLVKRGAAGLAWLLARLNPNTLMTHIAIMV